MGVAWIAVVGTLSGVVVTAASSLTINALSNRHQRDVLNRQLEAAAIDRNRKEVRDSFIDYWAAYDALQDRILVFRFERQSQPESKAASNMIEAFAPDESTQFNRATNALAITAATSASIEAADAAMWQLWRLAQAAEVNDTAAFDAEWAAGYALRRQLRSAMRAELGAPEIPLPAPPSAELLKTYPGILTTNPHK
ncbi:hypothetical protein ACFXHA_40955 [Nocardia sp. NPDC059240]|uniref:hypothetical protein n=1 Tax=Nocardia sp. NPDC059240 TaxID=3346786 RepID=UPI003691A219